MLSITLITSHKISSLSYVFLREFKVTMHYSILRNRRRLALSIPLLGMMTSALKACTSDAMP